MIEHRPPRPGLVAPTDGAKDPPVVLMGASRPARSVQALLPTLREEIDERVDDANDRRLCAAAAMAAWSAESWAMPVRPRATSRACSARMRSISASSSQVARRAARAAIAGLEEAARLGRAAPTASAVRQDDERQGLDEGLDRDVRGRNVPSPALISIKPRLCSDRSASRTEVRLTRKRSAKSRSGGNLSPDLRWPSAIKALTWRTMSS